MSESEYCPTQSGCSVGYEIEVQNEDGVWKRLPTRESVMDDGVPYSGPTRHLCAMFGMLGYSQAMALAWTFIATRPLDAVRGVRVVPYAVEYDIKWLRQEAKAESVGRDRPLE